MVSDSIDDAIVVKRVSCPLRTTKGIIFSYHVFFCFFFSFSKNKGGLGNSAPLRYRRHVYGADGGHGVALCPDIWR